MAALSQRLLPRSRRISCRLSIQHVVVTLPQPLTLLACDHPRVLYPLVLARGRKPSCGCAHRAGGRTGRVDPAAHLGPAHESTRAWSQFRVGRWAVFDGARFIQLSPVASSCHSQTWRRSFAICSSSDSTHSTVVASWCSRVTGDSWNGGRPGRSSSHPCHDRLGRLQPRRVPVAGRKWASEEKWLGPWSTWPGMPIGLAMSNHRLVAIEGQEVVFVSPSVMPTSAPRVEIGRRPRLTVA